MRACCVRMLCGAASTFSSMRTGVASITRHLSAAFEGLDARASASSHVEERALAGARRAGERTRAAVRGGGGGPDCIRGRWRAEPWGAARTTSFGQVPQI